MKAKEDPADKASRLRERRITEVERQKTTEQSASGLTSDLRAVYGMRGLSMFGASGTGGTKVAAPTRRVKVWGEQP